MGSASLARSIRGRHSGEEQTWSPRRSFVRRSTHCFRILRASIPVDPHVAQAPREKSCEPSWFPEGLVWVLPLGSHCRQQVGTVSDVASRENAWAPASRSSQLHVLSMRVIESCCSLQIRTGQEHPRKFFAKLVCLTEKASPSQTPSPCRRDEHRLGSGGW